MYKTKFEEDFWLISEGRYNNCDFRVNFGRVSFPLILHQTPTDFSNFYMQNIRMKKKTTKMGVNKITWAG